MTAPGLASGAGCLWDTDFKILMQIKTLNRSFQGGFLYSRNLYIRKLRFTEMIDLITQNKFEELKEVLKNSNNFKIHHYLLEILNGNTIEVDSSTKRIGTGKKFRLFRKSKKIFREG